MSDLVELWHPVLDRVIEVGPDAIRHLGAVGWVPIAERPQPAVPETETVDPPAVPAPKKG